MKSQSFSLLSILSHSHPSLFPTTRRNLFRLLSTSTFSHTHSSSRSTRTITTKTKNRGPAQPVSDRVLDHEFIVESDYQDDILPNIPAPFQVFKNSAQWSNKTAMECSLTGRSYTYGQMLDGVMRFGGALQRIISLKGKEENNNSTVAILSPNCPEYPIAFFGGMVMGGTVTPINPTYTPSEIAHHLVDSGADVLVVDSVLEPLAQAALDLLNNNNNNNNIPQVIVNGNSMNGRPNLREIITDTNVPFATHTDMVMESIATLPYSSGTTGKPKGVCISHRAFSNSLGLFHHPSANAVTPATDECQEVMVGLLPFFHIYGMMAIMASGMTNGAKIVTMPQFDPKLFLNLLTKHKVTRLHLVPPLLNFLAASPLVHASIISNINTILCGAAPVPPSSAALLKAKAKQHIFFQEGFGMTETMCTHITPKGEERLGWCGKLMAHVRAKVVDQETGIPLPPGHKGELIIDTPALMSGYHNNEGATKECYDAKGWFRTGDVAIYDEDGFFSIVDRIKELIKVKGLQVSPSELEDLLLGYPGVAEVGVVGVPDAKAGEVPKAYIVPQGDITKEELHRFVSCRVAPHKQLVGGIEFVDQLPKNPTGKLLRRELKRMSQAV